MKFAILFPGQGSQKVGMGKDLLEIDSVKQIFDLADSISGRNLSNIWLNGPENELNQTKNTQISIVTISAALTTLFKEFLSQKNLDLDPIGCCGHSLGEFTALWFTNIISIEELFNLIIIRGNLMQNASEGGMLAVLNLNEGTIKDLLNDKYFNGKFVIANYNTSSQIVLSGDKNLFIALQEKIKNAGGKSIILPVGGAFHSPSMEKSSRIFDNELDKLSKKFTGFTKNPIYQNIDGKPSTDHKIILEKIKKQMTSSVRWTQTVEYLVKDGVTDVIEIGPGKILTGLVKKINSAINCHNINNLSSLNEFIKYYESANARTRT